MEYFEMLYALAKAGMTAVPVNFRLVGKEISYIVNHGDSRALIY
jgi:acyl-CoA synthetase (AMP-forming)/AMP-acid ligase II